MNRYIINIERNKLLKKLRKGKKGRPYCGVNHYSRKELNILRNIKLEKIMNQILL